MKKLQLDFSAIKQLHQQGELKTARAAYADFIAENPKHVDALHLYAVLCAEEQDFPMAQALMQKAIVLSPDDPALKLHLANILKAQGDFAAAENTLNAILQSHPRFAAGYNNLGTLYFAQQQWQKASTAYQSAIDLQPDYADAYYNLGLALIKMQQIEPAFNTLLALLELAPQHVGAQFQLGCLWMQKQQYQKAIEQFELIEKNYPFHFETQANLATSYLRLGDVDAAKAHYLKALDITPDDAQILFNLGVISMQQGRMQESISFYTRVLEHDAQNFSAQNNLGIAYYAEKDFANALLHFRAAQAIQPQNTALAHTINILTQEKKLDFSPTEYIQSLFDSYADHYDSHLLHTLHYQTPKLFYDVIKKQVDVTRFDILDLGCGTGLCGELFKPWARSLIGVDLSKNMLEIAARKKLYDDLVQVDVMDFLSHQHAAYDLILAGDVLVYFGELAPLFSAVHRALRQDGLFVFNTEISVQSDYHMTESGRFAHRKEYIDQLITTHHFQLVQYEMVTLRTQNYDPVRGHLYLLRKL